jgi:hypothetical protein
MGVSSLSLGGNQLRSDRGRNGLQIVSYGGTIGRFATVVSRSSLGRIFAAISAQI